MNSIHVGAQLFSVRDYLKTPEEIDRSLSRIHDSGFSMVQISGMGKIDAHDLRGILDKYGLSVSCTHNPLDRLKNDLPALIEEHKIIGCRVMGLGMMSDEFRQSKETVLEFAELANKIGKELHKENMIFGYHNHAFEFQKFDGKTIWDILIENTDPEYVGFIPDVHWFQAGGMNPPDVLNTLGKRTLVCHLKDYTVSGWERRFAVLGEGTLDFAAILKVLEKNGITETVIEQDDCYGRDPFECLAKSREYITNLMKELA